MKKWTLMVLGYVMALVSFGLLVVLAWKILALTILLFVGLGIVGTGKGLGTKAKALAWEPKNVAGAVERIAKVYGYQVADAWDTYELADKAVREDGMKEADVTTRAYLLVVAIHQATPKEVPVKDRRGYVTESLRTLMAGDQAKRDEVTP